MSCITSPARRRPTATAALGPTMMVPGTTVTKKAHKKSTSSGCKVDGCTSCEPGKSHYCKNCKNRDSYHSCKKCPKLHSCKVKGCTACKSGKEHRCKKCGDKDSMHFSSKCSKRHVRLMSNVKTLYHQTNATSFRLIEQSGLKMLRGSSGMAGGGIYFAVSKGDTDHKAHKKGVMLTCSVRLGKVKKIAVGGDVSVTFKSLQEEGFDSVEIPRPGGTEYVVYNLDQARVVKHKTM